MYQVGAAHAVVTSNVSPPHVKTPTRPTYGPRYLKLSHETLVITGFEIDVHATSLYLEFPLHPI